MLKLPVVKPLRFFSPTSFRQACECELSFYYQRMSEFELVRMPQTEAMAIGTAFDAFVKAEIARLLGKPNRLNQLLGGLEEQNLNVIPHANALFEAYNYCGRVEELMKEGIEDIELSIERTVGGSKVAGTQVNLGGVPIFGKPDMRLGFGHSDWKVNGFGSKTGQSPKPGYKSCKTVKFKYPIGSVFFEGNSFSYTGEKGHHERFGEPLELIDSKWAEQLLFYSWLDGVPIEGDRQVGIEQIAIRGETVAFASFRTKISKEFALNTYATLVDKWQRFNQGEFEDAIPDMFKCEPYNFPRTCTLVCTAYKNTLGDKMQREVMLANRKR